ncbi:MAG: 30S ribosomal protein S12 methylthiotransferase RimO, partial [Reyranellaceae bacterium]
EVKEERWHRFMQAQQAISARRLAAKVGRTIEVLVDDITPQGAICRSHADAPEIDGTVILREAGALKPGDLANVIVEKADAYDLYARPVSRRSR